MATGTWNINVLSVEPECSLVVIKPGSFPVFRAMTVSTSGDPIFGKLPVMAVCMAISAIS
jgi:hypothetical protein